ncbi:MAG: zinc dependent phospholipase C family protein [Nanobdellota archaeon]
MLIKDKRGLNRRGHILFALGLAGFIIYFLSHYIQIPYLALALHFPFFILGAIMPDIFESSYHNPSHRGFLHRGYWLLTLPLILAILFYFRDNYKVFYFLEESLSWFSIITAFCLGWMSHLLGDSLTSKLK